MFIKSTIIISYWVLSTIIAASHFWGLHYKIISFNSLHDAELNSDSLIVINTYIHTQKEKR